MWVDRHKYGLHFVWSLGDRGSSPHFLCALFHNYTLPTWTHWNVSPFMIQEETTLSRRGSPSVTRTLRVGLITAASTRATMVAHSSNLLTVTLARGQPPQLSTWQRASCAMPLVIIVQIPRVLWRRWFPWCLPWWRVHCGAPCKWPSKWMVHLCLLGNWKTVWNEQTNLYLLLLLCLNVYRSMQSVLKRFVFCAWTISILFVRGLENVLYLMLYATVLVYPPYPKLSPLWLCVLWNVFQCYVLSITFILVIQARKCPTSDCK